LFKIRRTPAAKNHKAGPPEFMSSLETAAHNFASSAEPTIWSWPNDLVPPAAAGFASAQRSCLAALNEWAEDQRAEYDIGIVLAAAKQVWLDERNDQCAKDVTEAENELKKSQADLTPDRTARRPVVSRWLEVVLVAAVGVADVSVRQKVFQKLISGESANSAYALAVSASIILLAGALTLGRTLWRIVHRPSEQAPDQRTDKLLAGVMGFALSGLALLLAIARATTVTNRDTLAPFHHEQRQGQLSLRFKAQGFS
jgi:hypothetical protein